MPGPKLPTTTLPVRILLIAYLACVAPLGVALALLTPPGEVADEVNHVLRATALADGHVLGRRVVRIGENGARIVEAGVDTDFGAAAAMSSASYDRRPSTHEEVARMHRAAWLGEDRFLQMNPLAVYLPVCYVPAAAGLGVARWLGAGPYDAILAGRLANLLVCVAMGAATLLFARRGRAVLFCVISVPMSVSLAASFNQDGLIIAASAFAASLATRGWSDRPARWGAMALIGGVALAKLPYLVLGAMLLPPLHDRGGAIRRLRAIVLLGLPALAWAAYAMAAISAPAIQPDYAPGPLWKGPAGTIFHSADAWSQVHVLLAKPARLLTLPLHSIATDPFMARQLVGILGWLSLNLPDWLYAAWAVAIGCAVGADGLEPQQSGVRWRWWDGALLLLAVFGGFLLVYWSQYLIWTQVGHDRVDGPQGRYLLPLAPMLAMAIPKVAPPIVAASRSAAALCVPAAAAAAAGLAVLPSIVVGAFYQ